MASIEKAGSNDLPSYDGSHTKPSGTDVLAGEVFEGEEQATQRVRFQFSFPSCPSLRDIQICWE